MWCWSILLQLRDQCLICKELAYINHKNWFNQTFSMRWRVKLTIWWPSKQNMLTFWHFRKLIDYLKPAWCLHNLWHVLKINIAKWFQQEKRLFAPVIQVRLLNVHLPFQTIRFQHPRMYLVTYSSYLYQQKHIRQFKSVLGLTVKATWSQFSICMCVMYRTTQFARHIFFI